MSTNSATQLNNVVGFSNISVSDKIDSFLNTYESTNTRNAYKNYYNIMFMYLCGKELSDLTIDDVKSIEIVDVKRFREHLRYKYKVNTINQIVFACKALFSSFKEDGMIHDNSFDIAKIKTKQKEVHYGSLTADELNGLYEYCLTLKKGMTKKLYFEFLATVTCRKTVAQELKFENIKRKRNKKTNTEYWVVDVYDKTDEVNRAITDEFYDRIKSNFDSYEWYDQKKGYVFNLENKTLDKTLKDYCEYAGIDRVGRNIVQHSIKSSGLDMIQDTFGDINITAKAAGHKNIQTAYNNYIGKNVDYSQQPSILLGTDYDFDKLGELSKDELINVIKLCGRNSMIKVYLKAKEVGLICDCEMGEMDDVNNN